MIGKVTVKEEYIPGTQLNPGVYSARQDMCFEVEGDVPSTLRRAARAHFMKSFSAAGHILSVTSPSRDTVQILFRRGRPKPVKEKGWEHRGPRR